MSGQVRLSAAVLLLVAFVLRAAIPDGWMPSASGVPQGPLVICTGAGPLVVGHRAQHPGKPPVGDHRAPCAFAGVGSGPPASAPPFLEPLRFAASERPQRAAPRAPPSRERHREQSARGPPLQV